MSVVTPFWAVTIVVMVVVPTESDIAPEAEPLETVVPLTLTVAPTWLTVGVTVILLTAFATLSIYETVPEVNVGESEPLLMTSELSVASELRESVVNVESEEVANSELALLSTW